MSENLVYELKSPFSIAKSGEQEDATRFEITAPTNKVLQYITIVEQEFIKAALVATKGAESKEGNKEEQSSNISSGEIMLMMTAGGADLFRCFNALSSILSFTCKINDSVLFTKYMFPKLDYSDTKNLLGEYIKFFLSSSLMN